MPAWLCAEDGGTEQPLTDTIRATIHDVAEMSAAQLDSVETSSVEDDEDICESVVGKQHAHFAWVTTLVK